MATDAASGAVDNAKSMATDAATEAVDAAKDAAGQ